MANEVSTSLVPRPSYLTLTITEGLVRDGLRCGQGHENFELSKLLALETYRIADRRILSLTILKYSRLHAGNYLCGCGQSREKSRRQMRINGHTYSHIM